MQYVSFQIQNFKGIRNTTVKFDTLTGARVFSFVGLNESGKTTVLEAIHSFAPDEATSELLGGAEGVGVPFKDRVPRHLLSEFNGDVSVVAKLSVTAADKERIINSLKSSHDLDVNPETFPSEISFRRTQRFQRGDFTNSYFTLLSSLEIKRSKQRKWRNSSSAPVEERTLLRDSLFAHCPRIAYFPTFVFDFPKTIFLTNRGGIVDTFYRHAFQDILDYDDRGQTIENDIIRRIRKDEMRLPWASFFSVWTMNDDREKIQHVMDRASAAVTKLVFGRWNQIFGEDAKGKEVSISFDIIEGETEDEAGNKTKTNDHDIQVKFQVKDGTRRYDVNDRSLGFRWFFSFMLFTQFRAARSSEDHTPLVFLFDEPATNLHAAAQQKLTDSFPEVTRNGHILGYSTHSHYMIEPKWLEQTFIVTNREDAPSTSVVDEISMDDESLDITVETYRSFVNSYPSKTSYFQPILDRLDVVPSRFDIHEASVVLEGRSDYYILRYASKLLNVSDLPLIPGLGAGTFGALAALHVGWNLNFLFLLDGDKAGRDGLKKYRDDFGIDAKRLFLISDIAAGVNTIEDMLDDEAKEMIQHHLQISETPSKAQIKRFFQERLASDNVIPLGGHFRQHSSSILGSLREHLEN